MLTSRSDMHAQTTTELPVQCLASVRAMLFSDDLAQILSHRPLLPSHTWRHLLRFLVAQMAKDCSILVAFDSEDKDLFNVQVVDTDLKSLDKFEKWVDLDRKIVDAYRRMAGTFSRRK